MTTTWHDPNKERIADYFAFVEEYRARRDDDRLRRLIVHVMGERFLTDNWWFTTPPADLTKIIAIASDYPESITAFFHDRAAREHSRHSFAVPSQWLAIWDLREQQSGPVAKLLIALCNFEPGKRLVDLPAPKWWSAWETAIAPFDPARLRDPCEQLWTIPTLSESVGGYYAGDLAKSIGRAAIWGIAAVADRHTVDVLSAVPHQIKQPIFVPAMAILSLGQVHRRLHQLAQELKGKTSQRVIGATLARIAAP